MKYQTRLAKFADEAAQAAALLTDGDSRAVKLAGRAAWRRYRYVDGGFNAKGQAVWFCWSTGADHNGLWWSWREVHTKLNLKRYQMSSRKTKAAAKALAYRRQNRWAET